MYYSPNVVVVEAIIGHEPPLHEGRGRESREGRGEVGLVLRGVATIFTTSERREGGRDEKWVRRRGGEGGEGERGCVKERCERGVREKEGEDRGEERGCEGERREGCEGGRRGRKEGKRAKLNVKGPSS